MKIRTKKGNCFEIDSSIREYLFFFGKKIVIINNYY